MLIEDEPLIRMDVEGLLHDFGYRVTAVANADLAFEVLANQKIDILLTDIDIPGSMDGLGLAVTVRNRWPPGEIIIMSGKRRPNAEQLPTRARFLAKPLNPSDLSKAMADWE